MEGICLFNLYLEVNNYFVGKFVATGRTKKVINDFEGRHVSPTIRISGVNYKEMDGTDFLKCFYYEKC